MWTELLIAMREMLARCWILCEMRYVTGGGFYSDMLEEEDRTDLEAAIDELGDDFRRITPADALAAVIKRETQDEQFRGGLQAILGLFDEEARRRGLSPEEKGRLTLGDLFSAANEDDEEEDQ
jgi:hypothetical protein